MLGDEEQTEGNVCVDRVIVDTEWMTRRKATISRGGPARYVIMVQDLMTAYFWGTRFHSRLMAWGIVNGCVRGRKP